MSKSKVSDAFSTFTSKNEHKLEEAKTAEKQTRGIPLPVGTVGVAVISDARADRAKSPPNNPYVIVEITVLEPEEHRGVKIPGCFHSIWDSENMSAAGRFAILLDDLENMGLPREIREKHGTDIGTCLDYLLEEPHYVTYEIKLGYKDRKEAVCFATSSPEGKGSSNRCEYMGQTYEITGKDEDGNLLLKNEANPSKTRSVPEDSVKML